jgi:hypothetical protein
LFCENCGLQFFPGQSLCTRCRVVSTRHWFQLTSLVTLLIAAVCNSAAFFLLPRLAAAHTAGRGLGSGLRFIRAWLWIDAKTALYGWVPLALALLTWDYFAWPESRPILKERIRRWSVRALLIFAFVGELLSLFPRWFRPTAALLATAAKVPRFSVPFPPGLSVALPWLIVAVASGLLCINADTRDSLLGRGRALSALSLGVLVMVMTLTLLAFVP